MFKYRGFIKELTNAAIEGLFINAHAEGEDGTGTEPDNSGKPNPEPQKKAPEINYEDLIAKARKEEKDKLYPQIEALKKDKDTLTKRVNELLIEGGRKDAEIEELKAQKTGKGSKEVEELKTKINDLTAALAQRDETIKSYDGIEERFKAEYEVKLYREQKLIELSNQVIPELVTGLSKEDIDASIEASKARYQELFKAAGGTVPNTPPPTTPNPPPNMGSSFSIDQLNGDDISKMSAKEWKTFRENLGLK